MDKSPKLRTVEKYRPPYPLNEFPEDFAARLGEELVYLLASRGAPRLAGEDWEEIFARIVGAQWKPSNVGLDDIVLEQTAWGAKTIKHSNPAEAKRVRLISGRNSPVYSFGDRAVSQCDPDELGEKILAIWNERVAAIRARYRHVRTVVLVKSSDLLEVSVFELETVIYPAEAFRWNWNQNDNLEGFSRADDEHRFTWQPHGSQFTLIESAPESRLAIRLKQPPTLDREAVLQAIQFDPDWIQTIPSGDPHGHLFED